MGGVEGAHHLKPPALPMVFDWALQSAGFHPAFAPRGGEFSPKRLKRQRGKVFDKTEC
jgi:hypothetical protein